MHAYITYRSLDGLVHAVIRYTPGSHIAASNDHFLGHIEPHAMDHGAKKNPIQTCFLILIKDLFVSLQISL